MQKHKVTSRQNVFDIALQRYGTIEGLFDLFISNPSLSFAADLKPGEELHYHDYFVTNKDIHDRITKDGLVPANGERNVYYRHTSEPLVFVFAVNPDATSTGFTVRGDGAMVVDWGDNTDLETIALTNSDNETVHYFNSNVENRRVRIYGTFELFYLDASKANGDMFVTRPVCVDRYVSNENGNSLQGLRLFDGTVEVDLRGMSIPDLSPIYGLELTELNLLGAKFPNAGVLDSYLTNIVANYGNRRGCTVLLDTEPTEAGMGAIQTIIGEPGWNESGEWRFVINDIIYTA